MKNRVLSCVFLGAMLVGAQALAKDIHVKAGASGGDGSKGAPYGSVDDALREAFAGDVIHVARGDYFGPGGSGKFTIDKPDITLVGGYNDDFSARDPFTNITRLMRGADADPLVCLESPRCKELVERQKIPQTKASYNPKGIVVGEKEHRNFILDGFVIDGYTRHKYKPNDDLSLAMGPIGTPCLQFNKPGVKVRNNIILNCAGPGISMNALGTKLDKDDKREAGDDWAEVSNNIILNTLMQSIDLRVGNMDPKNAPDGGAALVKNNTLAFNWEHNGEDYNLLQGRQTRLTVSNNILSFAGYGINNGFGNRFGRLVDNVFFSHVAGHYKYWDESASGATLIMDEPEKLEGDTCKKKYSCSKQSQGNRIADPQFTQLDGFFFDRFMNQIASSGGGKVNMDAMNQWRSVLGLPLQGSAGSGKVNYAPIWDPGEDWSKVRLFAQGLSGKGAQPGPFASYASTTGSGVDPANVAFVEMAWESLGRGQGGTKEVAAKGEEGLHISTVMKLSQKEASSWYLPASLNVSRETGWTGFRDEKREIFLYVQVGSEGQKAMEQALKESSQVTIRGRAVDISAQIKSPGRVGIMVLSAEVGNDED